MRIHIIAVGRARGGPEAALVADYLTRFDRAGRALGLGPARLVEVEDRKGGGMAAEAELLTRVIPARSLVAVLDERGETPTSPEFAARLAHWRDSGWGEVTFVIGGADGLDESVRRAARSTLAFGPQTWPHALARAMLAEQVYRAVTILAGGPYHRD